MTKKIKITAQPTPENNLTFADALQEFFDYQIANARSSQTAETYISSLRVFSKWAFANYPNDFYLREFNNKKFINEYVMWLRTERNNNENTVAFHKRHLRVFLYWCMDKQYISEYVVDVKKPQEEIPETYTKEEIELLIKKPKTKEFVENRNWVIINLLLSLGNRRNTITGYRMKDLLLREGWLTTNQTKSKKAQRFPLNQHITKILGDYVKLYRSEASADEPLFPEQFGGFMNPNSLTHSINKYNKSRGVSKTSIHTFRHTFAKNWVVEGGDSLMLQRILGHSSLTMTENYVRLFGEDLKPYVERYNPLANYSNSRKTKITRNNNLRKAGRGSRN